MTDDQNLVVPSPLRNVPSFTNQVHSRFNHDSVLCKRCFVVVFEHVTSRFLSSLHTPISYHAPSYISCSRIVDKLSF